MNWKNKNVLITGINGFVGSYLAKRLIDENVNVYGLIRDSSKVNSPNLVNKNIERKFNPIIGDLTDITSISNALCESRPDYIFHLAAQSFVPISFKNPKLTYEVNATGTLNLLEAIRQNECEGRMIFAGSGDEYGLVISSKKQYLEIQKKYRSIFPSIGNEFESELAINENNPLRPMNPYATSKVNGEFLTRNYFNSYDLDCIVARCFNHEGAGRGKDFVTSVITSQVADIISNKTDTINIGNVNALRDWTHIDDMIESYLTLAQNAESGEVYNQGSMRTNSILSYILLSIQEAGFNVNSIETFNGDKKISNPTEINEDKYFDVHFKKTKVDSLFLDDELDYTIKDRGINVDTDNKEIRIVFNPERFRPSDVPILLSDTGKIEAIGFNKKYEVNNIIKDQLNDYLKIND
ncbi:MAG: GDP-mannose 4,6-dehydratase [Methanosphaera sp.]|nr:GDP-mannose 4,6-dehydratase [Methanosphaera sp.]